jgi:hypothetical protein
LLHGHFEACGYFPYKSSPQADFAKHGSIISLQPDLKYEICIIKELYKMRKSLLLSLIVLILSVGLSNCKSNKVTCPAYGGNEKPGAIPKSHKTQSGVMPTGGRSKKTKLPR